jgi:hypothetical protein
MKLFDLLPAYHRQLDAENGGQLEQLLQIMQEQYDLVQADMAQMYENWFIETCADWVVPYLGDLVGYKASYQEGQTAEVSSREAQLRGSILIPRRDVANTIRYRRRKGSLALLEDLCSDVTGWPSQAVEFGSFVSSSVPVSYPFPRRAGTVDVRHGNQLQQFGSAFDSVRRSIDVRRMGSHRKPGRYSMSSVGLFVSRMASLPFLRVEPFQTEDAGDQCFTFSPLGNDSPLFSRAPETDSSGPVPKELRLPGPISRRAFEERKRPKGGGAFEHSIASDLFYGEGKSVALYVRGWDREHELTLVPREKIIPAHLSHWRYRTPPGHIAVDPELGRFAFAIGETPKDVLVSFYGASGGSLGGGQYPRTLSSDLPVIKVDSTKGTVGAFAHALNKWREKKLAQAVIEFQDSESYEEERLHIELEDDQCLIIRGAAGQRPVLRFIDTHQIGRGEGLVVTGKRKSRLTIDGLVVTGRGVQLKGELEEFRLRHATLVPGWRLNSHGHPRHETEPSLLLQDTEASVIVEHSICGSIQVRSATIQHEPNRISISDSIIDACRPHGEALCSPGSIAMFVALRIRRSTVIGFSCVHSLELAENSIFLGPVNVARRQKGCVRFCYLPPSSRTPRRYECQPDMAAAGLAADALAEAQMLVAPIFISTRFGTPTYCQLDDLCPMEIRSGADDRSEMGAFHDSFRSQREADLLSRLEDFVPAGTDVGLIFTT